MSEPADALHKDSEVVFARSDVDGTALFKSQEADLKSSSLQPIRSSQNSEIAPASHD